MAIVQDTLHALGITRNYKGYYHTVYALSLIHISTGYVFSRWDAIQEPLEEVFTIYEFTGYDRDEVIQNAGVELTVLGEKGETTYVAQIADGELAAQIRCV